LLSGVEYQAAAPDVIALTSAAWDSVQQVQQAERLLPIAPNRYRPHQQFKRPSPTLLPQAMDQKAAGSSPAHMSSQVRDLAPRPLLSWPVSLT
jgi:hypothetical protein